jgi:hypothetical protein
VRGAADPSERRLLRNERVRLLAFAGRDAEVRRALTDAAGRSLDDPQALDPGIRSTSSSVAVQELGKPFADRLGPLIYTSSDPHLRRDAVSALAHAEQPPFTDEVYAMVLDKRADSMRCSGSG